MPHPKMTSLKGRLVHHSFAVAYGENNQITASGIVANFEWVNPQALLYVDGRDAGKPGRWKLEMCSPGGGLEGRELEKERI